MRHSDLSITLTGTLEEALLDLSTIDLDGIEFVNLSGSLAFPDGGASCGSCADPGPYSCSSSSGW